MRSLVVVCMALAALTGCKKKAERAEQPAAAAEKAPSDIDGDAKMRSALAMQTATGDPITDPVISKLQKRLELQPKYVDGWVALGQQWVRKARRSGDEGFYLNANACAELALQHSENHPEAMNLRAIALLNAHRFAEARDQAKAIVKEHPENAMAWGSISDAELELGNYEASVDAAQKMLDIKPNLPSYSRAAYLAWLHGDLEKARAVYTSAWDAGRGHSDKEPAAFVLVDAAMMFWHGGDLAGAEAGFDMALSQLADFPAALVGKARVALARGQFGEAATLLRKAWTARPLVETGWLLVDALEGAKDTAGAKEAQEALIALGQKTDKKTLAAFYAAKNTNVQTALSLIESEAKTRGGIYVDDIRAWSLYRAGRPKEALKHSERAVRLGTPNATLLYHHGAIQIATGQVETGTATVEKALKLNPNFDIQGAREARELLNQTRRKATGG